MFTRSYSFAEGNHGPWLTWMPTSVAPDGMVRFHAPGRLDDNHLDNNLSLRLLAHLPIAAAGTGTLDLRNAEITVRARGHDLEANGAKLVWWIVSNIPADRTDESFYPGIQSTNWFYPAGDMAPQLTDSVQDLTVTLPDDEALWTYAGNNVSGQGDWGGRYTYMPLPEALASVSATLHLAFVHDDPHVAPRGFVDIESITIATQQPFDWKADVGGSPVALNRAPSVASLEQAFFGAPDEPITGILFRGTDPDSDALTFELVPGSVENGTLDLDRWTGLFTFTPEDDHIGPAQFRYRVHDGQLVSAEERIVTFEIGSSGAPNSIGDFYALWTQGLRDEAIHVAFQLAQRRGDPEASYIAGFLARRGIYVEENTPLAAALLEQAIDIFPDANVELATLLIGGNGVAKDYARAVELLRAVDGLPNAKYELAKLHELGFGFEAPDPKEALLLYLEAAGAGVPSAMYTLGRRYLAGVIDVVDPSAEDAYFWLRLSQEKGIPPHLSRMVAYNVDQAEARLSSDQIAILEAGIDAWEPGYPSPGNDAPIPDPAPEAFAGLEDQSVSGDLAQGRDPDGHAFTFRLVNESVLHGSVSIDPATGAFQFLPEAKFAGEASFQYVLSDGFVESAPKTVLIEIAAADQTLIAGADGGMLVGGRGNDKLTAGPGVDVLRGGKGNDTYYYPSDTQDRIEENADEGTDAVVTRNTFYVLPKNVENLFYFGDSEFVGVGNDSGNYLQAYSGRSYLLGLDGRDILVGKTGTASTLQGGGGDDTYFAGSGDTVFEFENEGIDTVLVALSKYMLPKHLENLIYTGSGSFSGHGNDANNIIKGGPQGDVLFGGPGNDTLDGGGGNDWLYGDAGRDLFVFRFGYGTDTVVGFEGGTGPTDCLDLRGLFETASQVFQAATFDGENTIITAASGESIILQKFWLWGNLSRDDFII